MKLESMRTSARLFLKTTFFLTILLAPFLHHISIQQYIETTAPHLATGAKVTWKQRSLRVQKTDEAWLGAEMFGLWMAYLMDIV